jgi:pimeloyl-ACP methyl ester carboxylesterase
VDVAMISLADWRSGGEFFDFESGPERRAHRVFFRRAGSGEALLLIHGFPTASWDFAKLWPPLTQRFSVVAPDMLGFGFSDKPRDFPYSTFAQADVMEALLRKLGIDRCHVLAHDYGDTIAQELLARQLEGKLGARLLSVCFLNGGLFPETHHALLIQKLALTPLGPLITRLTTKRRFKKTMDGLFAPDHPPTEEEIDGFYALITNQDGLPLLARHLRYLIERRVHRERFVGAIVKATIPRRLIDGALDPVSGAHMATRYRELIPHPDVVLLSHLGHYPHVEDSPAVLAPFLDFHERIAKVS